MTVDVNAKLCTRCEEKFSLVRRRHWCKQCGRTICADCSATNVKWLYGSKRGCVCIDCSQQEEEEAGSADREVCCASSAT